LTFAVIIQTVILLFQLQQLCLLITQHTVNYHVAMHSLHNNNTQFSPISPNRNPFRQILDKYSMSQCSCFVGKNHTPYLQLHF